MRFPPQPQLLTALLFSQYKHGGPIIAVQVENEYGSYNKDPAYMPYIKKVRVSSAHLCAFPLWALLRRMGLSPSTIY